MPAEEQHYSLHGQLPGSVMSYVFQLAGDALTANPAVPLHRYVLAAQRLMREADRQGAMGNLLIRSVLLVRFVQLVTKTMPQHPAWSQEPNRALREALRQDAREVLNDLEQLRATLTAQWNESATAPSHTEVMCAVSDTHATADKLAEDEQACTAASSSSLLPPAPAPAPAPAPPSTTTTTPPPPVAVNGYQQSGIDGSIGAAAGAAARAAALLASGQCEQGNDEQTVSTAVLPGVPANHRAHVSAQAPGIAQQGDPSWFETPRGRAYTEQQLRSLMSRTHFIRDMFCQTWHVDPEERKQRMIFYLLQHAAIPPHGAALEVAGTILNEYLLVTDSPRLPGPANPGPGGTTGCRSALEQTTSQIGVDDKYRGSLATGAPLPHGLLNRHPRARGGAAPALQRDHHELPQADVNAVVERPRHSLNRMQVFADGDTNQHSAATETASFSTAFSMQWSIDFNDVIVGPKIGSGGYGEVFVGRYRDQLVAIKHLQPVDGVDSAQLLRSFQDEMMLMSKLSHPNIVRFIGACITPPNLCILSEYVHGGTLYRLLQKRRQRRLDPNTGEPTGETVVTSHLPWCGILRIALGIARGMRYLHAQRPIVVHRDLKSPNCLVFSATSTIQDEGAGDTNAVQRSALSSPQATVQVYGGPIRSDEDFAEIDVKLIDFGLSRTQLRSYISTGIAGTPEWMAPEVIRQDRVSESADIFSFGVILWELVTGRKPWEHLTQTQVVYRVGYLEEVLPMPPETHPSLQALYAAASQMNPASRPKFTDIVSKLEQLCRESGVCTETGEQLMRRRQFQEMT